MTSLRAATRRAVSAAFLLFAAGLLVVGPAEASRTTTDARPGLAPSASRELASLELPILEPLDSAESSPRFGFAEDLALLDVEARSCGFELFGGVGTNRCARTYARNNPLKYVDPDGRAAVLSLVPPSLVVGGMVATYAVALYYATAGPYLVNNARITTAPDFLFGLQGLHAEAEEPSDASGEAGNKSQGRSKTAEEMAADLADEAGRNSMPIETVGVKGHIDLQGKGHHDKETGKNIPTPHVQTKPKSVGPNGRTNLGPETVRPADKADVRLARRIWERIKDLVK